MNKSLTTNFTASAALASSFLDTAYSQQLWNVGLFALSGAITNCLSIHMLFEKVPGLYGSGIIPNKFEEFKTGIKLLMLNQFFTKDNMQRFIANQGQLSEQAVHSVLTVVDFDLLFEKLKAAVLESQFGTMIQMFGGPSALDDLRQPMIDKMRMAITELMQDPNTQTKLANALQEALAGDHLLDKIEIVVQSRLDELTPNIVKEIVQDMIREHLGWLVVWGGVFGGLIGLVASNFA